LRSALLKLDQDVVVSLPDGGAGLVRAVPWSALGRGSAAFMAQYGVRYPMYTGAMAKGIASADLVIAAGSKGLLASLGAGGLPLHRVTQALDKIQASLPNGPYAVNLIHSPFDETLEKGNVDLFLSRGVHIVEASAFMKLTVNVVRYRVAGLEANPSGGPPVCRNKIIFKVSRTELAEMAMRPPPAELVDKLLKAGQITAEQAALAPRVTMCDDVAVEADSGGHTDNRAMPVLLPVIIGLRDAIATEIGMRVRVGAGGGIGCPEAAAAAFAMGADFIVTGTINQMSRQAGTCDKVREQLSNASYSDVVMAPAADMFDAGVNLQVLSKGTMFPSRAKKLYELFVAYPSLEALPADVVKRLEERILQKPIAAVWEETVKFHIEQLKDPQKITRAERDPKLKMSLVFRWYLSKSSGWANNGFTDRALDFQVWCGPAIGSFNAFIKGTYLDPKVAGCFMDVHEANVQLLCGVCFMHRRSQLLADIRLRESVDGDALRPYRPEGPVNSFASCGPVKHAVLPLNMLAPSAKHQVVPVAAAAALRSALLKLDQDVVVSLPDGGAGLVRAVPWSALGRGSAAFMAQYGVRYPMYTGAMAKGIASADLVIAAGSKGLLASLGAGGLPLHRVTQALDKIQASLPNGPYAVNLIHSPFDETLEKGNVDLFLSRGVHIVEASAFMKLTVNVVRYRVAGLEANPSGGPPVCRNKIIFKVSRTELAEMAMRPPPAELVDKLLKAGQITAEQAALAPRVTMCDDVAVEADSGGHTDNRAMPVLLPVIIGLRDAIATEIGMRVRVGAGGGIGCPEAAAAAFAMGADFIVTGTINQMSRQAGTCDKVREQLSNASYSDVVMAPAADMFDAGVNLQVLSKGTMFPSRAKKLYELFVAYPSLEALPADVVKRLEERILQKPIAAVWEETVKFHIEQLKDPQKITRAERDPKLKMSLVFRWYLSKSSGWANNGFTDRALDFQVWCGPAIGSFNAFIKGTYLDPKVAGCFMDVHEANVQLLCGVCFMHRRSQLLADIRLRESVDGDALRPYQPEQMITDIDCR